MGSNRRGWNNGDGIRHEKFREFSPTQGKHNRAGRQLFLPLATREWSRDPAHPPPHLPPPNALTPLLRIGKSIKTWTPLPRWKSPDTCDAKLAIAVMPEEHGIACALMHGFTWDKWTTGTPTERLQLIRAGQEHILEQEDGKKR